MVAYSLPPSRDVEVRVHVARFSLAQFRVPGILLEA
jgi:hypothetical protein